MQIHVTDHDGVAVVALEGDAMGGPDGTVLMERIRERRAEGQTRFVVDLAGVERMNSSGLGMLIGALTTVHNADGHLVLANVHPRVHQLLDVTKLLGVFTLHDSEPAAVASFEG
ncbi:MAG: STAS domain-containing protein [Bacteroidota bacterium]